MILDYLDSNLRGIKNPKIFYYSDFYKIPYGVFNLNH